MRQHVLAILIASAAVSGCAPSLGAAVEGGAGEQNLSPEERRLQAVETKLAQVERRMTALNTQRFDEENARLRDDMRNLRGEVEKARFDMQQQDRRSKDLYQDLDRRLQSIETRGGAAPAAAPGYGGYAAPGAAAAGTISGATGVITQIPAVSGPVSMPGGPSVISSGGGASPEEEGAYLASFDLLKSGKYDDAIRGFRALLDKWPSGRYADNAAYWMGEANYVKRDYNAALTAFQTVITNYPSSPKAPDATLKLGLTQVELKQIDQGKATLQSVITKFPNANAARLATQKLATLNAQKR